MNIGLVQRESAAVGGGLGFACCKPADCASGTCLLASNPISSTLCGAAMGGQVAACLIWTGAAKEDL